MINNSASNRIVGWFNKYDKAEYVILNNINDINEHHFLFCVIEEISGGYVYPCPPKNEWWFRWYKNKDKYIKTDKPDMFKNIVNFGIG